ncbi:MAG TPA: Spy/CpxP family protein refolding chaperone [Candidatus Saccharimonadales bacterium]|nr:Spy/CpxP family protein refolding chaperone [Candidatus Saccharimonadales bacterium]
MSHRIVWTVALALAALAGPASAQREGGPAAGAAPPGRAAFAERLHLTDAQKAQLRQQWFAAAHRRVELGAKLADARLRLRELMTADKLDETAVRAQARALGDLQGQMVQARIENRLGMLGVLTAEQRETLRELRPGLGAGRGAGRMRRMPGMGPRRGHGAGPTGWLEDEGPPGPGPDGDMRMFRLPPDGPPDLPPPPEDPEAGSGPE